MIYPLVSLAMPVYNVERFVQKSLLSALSQTYENLEFLIIDDKSTDNSMQVVFDVIGQHPRKEQVRIIDHKHNRGLGDTRNTAIEEAKGKYIFFMDSDDLISPDCIEKLVGYMTDTPVDFIASSRRRSSFEGKLIDEDVYEPALITGTTSFAVAHFRYVENHKILGEIWNKLYNIEFLRKNNIRCIPGVHVEDVSFSLQVNIHAMSCRLVPDITYTYHIYEGQSFAAFHNNEQRALYLANCFVKIREYDVALLDKIERVPEFGAMLIGIYNVVLLHAGMISRSTILSATQKRDLYKQLLVYPYSFLQAWQMKTKRKHNIAYYLFCLLPTYIQYCVLKHRNK